MAARGYGTGRRTSFMMYRSRVYDAVLIAVSLALLGGAIFGAASSGGFVFYPSISVPRGFPAVIMYVFYGILCAIPSILEITERIKWRYLKSKI